MIRKYEEEDELRVNYLGKKYISETYNVLNRGEQEKIIVYEKENIGVIGFVQYSKLYEVLDIIDIVVDENYRRKKIGTYFLMYLCEDESVKKMMLEVRESNISAIKFYEKNCFIKLRPIENYYKDGENAYAMEKVIR